MSFLIDTNVISEISKKSPNPMVVQWLREHVNKYYLSTVTIGELRHGIELMQQSQRKLELWDWFREMCDSMRGRILNYNAATAHIWGQHVAAWETKGIIIPTLDSIIAATALRHDLIIVTRNVSDFSTVGFRVINPFELTEHA